MRLNGILQGVSLKGEIQNYLDFLRDDGTSFKLEVPEETVKILLAEIYGKKEEPKVAQAEEAQELPDVPEFGGDVGEEEEEEQEPEEEDDFPESEEEVRSV